MAQHPDNPIGERLAAMRQRIAAAEHRFRGTSGQVRLIGVSKRQPARAIQVAQAAGLTDIAENYLQEAMEKRLALQGLPLTWHFIGRIQSNKTRAIAGNFDWVHTVDRAKIARRLARQRDDELGPLNVCLQVDLDNEHHKAGVPPAALPELVMTVAELPRLRLRGLMAIPQAHTDFDGQRRTFARLRECLEDCNSRGMHLDTLSMGMSADFEAAIAEGSTMVRIGTALFGARAD